MHSTFYQDVEDGDGASTSHLTMYIAGTIISFKILNDLADNIPLRKNAVNL